MSGETDSIDIGMIGDLNIADQMLEQVEGTSYNMHTDACVAMNLNAALGVANELGRETIVKTGDFKPLSPRQAKAVSLYHEPGSGSSIGAMHDVDRVVAIESEDEKAKSTFDKARQTTIKTILSTTELMVEDLLSTAGTGFKHYAKLAKKIREDLTQYRKTVVENPDYYTAEESFAYGAYTRFFQAAGKKLTTFEEFSKVFTALAGVLQFSIKAAAPLADSNARMVIRALTEIQSSKASLELTDVELMLDRIRDDHFEVWRNVEADVPALSKTEYKPWVPDSLGAPGKERGGVAALFDNHALVWTAPSDFETLETNPKKLRADFFGAVLERDKSKDVKFDADERYLPLPDNKQLLDALDTGILMLSNVERYVEFASRIKDNGSMIKKQLKTLNAIISSDSNEAKLNVSDYLPFVLSVMRSYTSPHVKLLWMSVRACIMLAAIADTRLVIDPRQRKYAAVANATTDKITLKLDVEEEPDDVALKEVGYFNSMLLKINQD